MIASRWPLRDAAPLPFFATFYEERARGRSVGAAFSRARGVCLEGEFSVGDCSGLAVYGDASARFAQSSSFSIVTVSAWVLGIALVALATWLIRGRLT